MTSILHVFLQRISAVLFLGFILQLSFLSFSSIYLTFIEYIHSIEYLAFFLLINKLFAIFLIALLSVLVFVKNFVISPSYLKNISSLVYLALGFALMGFAKLTLGELNPFTLGFLEDKASMMGKDVPFDHNIIRIRDYSTMYTSPNGYFFYFILLINLVGVRAFSKVKKTGDPIHTKVPSRAEIKKSGTVRTKRRLSIDEDELNDSNENPNEFANKNEYDTNIIESSKKFELFEKEFSVQSPENLSQADSNTTNVKSSSSLVFLEKFQKLQKPSTIVSVLIKLKNNSLSIQTEEPQLVIFWMMTYKNYTRLTTLLITYLGLSLYLSGNAFTSDLLFGLILSKAYSRFYFHILERYF